VLTQWDDETGRGFEIDVDDAEFLPDSPQSRERILLGDYNLWELARKLFGFRRNPMKIGKVRIRVDWLEKE
jgi:hypothetical protein